MTKTESSNSILYYVHDPMCSWCWGFRPVWNQVRVALTGKMLIKTVLGGLAADCEQPMPKEMQRMISNTWQTIQQEIPGIEFNYDFWRLCQPRRSTYPACRAIIASRMQEPNSESQMLFAIQSAYYLAAKNPSDLDVLISLAEKIGLDSQQFSNDIISARCQKTLMDEIEFCRDIHVHSFPGLVLKRDNSYTAINIDYNDSTSILKQIGSK